jgi:acyl carrier protein
MSLPVHAQIRAVLTQVGLLQTDINTLADDADLYAAGLTSHATVNLMLALEEAFDIEFPDRLLRRRTFSSVNAIAESLTEIGAHKEAA